MKILYFISWLILELAFIGLAVFLSCWTNNFSYLWFLVIPIIGFCDYTDIAGYIIKKSTDRNKKEE